MTLHRTLERARGRWPEILARFGIDRSFLRNRHGPCPLCGGTDRFRFDDKNGTGSYYCNGCGASTGEGAGIRLLMKFKGWDFATAAREIDEIIGDCRPARPHSDAWRPAARSIKELMEGATDPSVVTRYLKRRGLVTASSPVLLGHPACPYYDEDHRLVDRFPAVLAPIRDNSGVLRGLQRIYDAEVVPRKKTIKIAQTILGCAVRLFEPIEDLGIAEGVENAVAAFDLFGIPTWSAISDQILKAFERPPGIKRIVIFGDNDRNNAGQAAAYDLAARLNGKLDIDVRIPPDPGTDWLDVLNARP